MYKLLTIDPASHQTGVAYFVDGVLKYATVLRAVGDFKKKELIDYTDEKVRRAASISKQMFDVCWSFRFQPREVEVIIEYPKVYPGNQEADPNDMIDIALVIGRLLEQLPEPLKISFPFAYEWKGQTKKKMMTKHIKTRLTAGEVAVMGKDVDNHNALDAVGIGLWKLRRLHG